MQKVYNDEIITDCLTPLQMDFKLVRILIMSQTKKTFTYICEKSGYLFLMLHLTALLE